jgi:hypothetical protein
MIDIDIDYSCTLWSWACLLWVLDKMWQKWCKGSHRTNLLKSLATSALVLGSQPPCKNSGWVLVPCACHPSYLGGWDQEDHRLRSTQEKSFQYLISTEKKLGMVALTCHLNVSRIHNMRIMVQSEKQDPTSKITRAKRTREVVQVVEQLTSKHKALSSNPIPQ